MVGSDGCGDRDRVHSRVGENGGIVGGELERRVAATDRLELLPASVADDGRFGPIDLVQVADEVRPPVPEPDDGHVHRLDRLPVRAAHAVVLLRISSKGVRNSSLRSRPSDQPRA
jgi:hypothetical protein